MNSKLNSIKWLISLSAMNLDFKMSAKRLFQKSKKSAQFWILDNYLTKTSKKASIIIKIHFSAFKTTKTWLIWQRVWWRPTIMSTCSREKIRQPFLEEMSKKLLNLLITMILITTRLIKEKKISNCIRKTNKKRLKIVNIKKPLNVKKAAGFN